ncbi:hypothetical protein [Terrabacter sp. NPDC080008]|uniref:hypothetical protein n=1 Tax=Terrabacter sp. NPDC080008 TaxID=3155176 RepID=UPI00344BD568
MSTIQETQTRHERRTLYIVVAAVVLVLVVVSLIAFRSGKTSREAEQKANQLVGELQAAGAQAPSQEAIVRLLGNDGGAVCADPNGALSRATLLAQLANGATGPGGRAVIANSRVVQGELLIIKVYCPEALNDFKDFVDSLKLESSGG